MFSVMAVRDTEPVILNGIPIGPDLTAEQAKAIYALGEQAVVFALLTQAKVIAEIQVGTVPPTGATDPSCPSGQIPTYQKPTTQHHRKKPGRKKGHLGICRKQPDHVDRTEIHRAQHCPDCGSPLTACTSVRDRYIEDIPEGIKVQVICHRIHRDFCPRCRKMVEPKVPDALPNATIGNRLLVLSAWLHFSLGNTISQILSVFNFHLQFQLSSGGLVQMGYRLADILEAWYDEIAQEIVQSAVLFGDETGWRLDGKTGWLWCFTSRSATLFSIERSRAGPVVLKFITEQFGGVLISDFWGAYNILTCIKQKCLVHLLRDLERVEQYKDTGQDWAAFAKKLRRLIRDAIRLRKRLETLDPTTYARRCQQIDKRLELLIAKAWVNKEVRRLIKRLLRHQQELFTFLSDPEVPFENNFAERMIRQAVIMRKNSYCNRSQRGAHTQAILMSVFTTLKQRGLNPMQTVEQALRTYITTGKLPTLADVSASKG